MIQLNTLTIKNFMSIGNITQEVDFCKKDLVLVLGENLDLGGNDNKNGVGKSSILNALCFVIYGWSLSSIKKDNLINKTNKKGMLVTLSFVVDGISYKIERGRKPGIFKFIKDGKESEFSADDTENNEAQGENKHTQEAIERLFGMSYDMFRHTVGLNTYVRPFLSLGASEQRSLIEELFGITKLSEKADNLKEDIKTLKEQIRDEEVRIAATQAANKKIEQNITSLELKSNTWEKNKQQNINNLQNSITKLLDIDIENEIVLHKKKKEFNELNVEYKNLLKEQSRIIKEIDEINKSITKIQNHLKPSNTKFCHTCNQEMDKDTHKKVADNLKNELKIIKENLSSKEKERIGVEALITTVKENLPENPQTFYSSIEDAYNHKSTLDKLAMQLDTELNSQNPYINQIESLQTTAIQEINYENINEMTSFKDHQEFLLKLLTNKDSFIRKNIIEKNLLFLNQRLSMYLNEIGLPHTVKFKSDLDVEITNFGEEFDFDNLSFGERWRLIISLCLSFRDVFEVTNQRINLLFIDELLDQGSDAAGTDNVLKILKNMSRNNDRNIFIISHKDEYPSRITNILKVQKQNRFSTIMEEYV